MTAPDLMVMAALIRERKALRERVSTLNERITAMSSDLTANERGQLEEMVRWEPASASVDPAVIPAQRAAGWPDFEPEDFCHRCGRRNIRAWHAPEWVLLVGSFSGILCPVCFADHDPGAIWTVTRYYPPDADRVADLTAFLDATSELGEDSGRVASCVLDFLAARVSEREAPSTDSTEAPGDGT